MTAGLLYGFNYAPWNFNSTDTKEAAVNQLYIRQAMQEATDQPGIVQNVFKNYGATVDAPLPQVVPASMGKAVPNPYPFDLNKAEALLTSNGWTLENKVMTCTSPGTGTGQCGAGITQGYTLNFTLVYASGSPSLTQEVTAEVADWAQIGVQVATTTESFNSVIGDCSSTYTLCFWGGGWTFVPNYFPTGEALFTVKGSFDPGGYNSPQMVADINATDFGHANLTAYATYAATNLPVLYEPAVATPAETIKTLHSKIGFTPSPLANFTPEYYYW